MADLAQLARKWNRHADEMTMIAPCRSERLEADVMRRCAAELLVALSEAALSHAAGQDGEQCRAASGVEEIARQMDAMAGHIQASSPEQKSERLRGWASMLRALSRGVPEGE